MNKTQVAKREAGATDKRSFFLKKQENHPNTAGALSDRIAMHQIERQAAASLARCWADGRTQRARGREQASEQFSSSSEEDGVYLVGAEHVPAGGAPPARADPARHADLAKQMPATRRD